MAEKDITKHYERNSLRRDITVNNDAEGREQARIIVESGHGVEGTEKAFFVVSAQEGTASIYLTDETAYALIDALHKTSGLGGGEDREGLTIERPVNKELNEVADWMYAEDFAELTAARQAMVKTVVKERTGKS